MFNRQRSRYVVVVVGNKGVGVSSTINLIANYPVSTTSPDTVAPRHMRKANGCPAEVAHTNIGVATDGNTLPHLVSLYEMPGFEGTVRDYKVIKSIHRLHDKVGIDLVLYCTKHPHKGLPGTCKKLRGALQNVRFGAVVTGLERETSMKDWWTSRSTGRGDPDASNGATLEGRLGLSFDNYVCVTTLGEDQVGHHPKLLKQRKESQIQLWALICRHCDENEKRPGLPFWKYYITVVVLNKRVPVSSR
ncbi:hypothetical protein J3A83DRAFT_1152667 [Scleroderma citrinum]